MQSSREREILSFIEDVSKHTTEGFYSSKMCYYFAVMLREAYGGKVCWVQDHGHIVWVDCDKDCSFEELQNKPTYDAWGVYMVDDNLWPVEYLGKSICNFKHNHEEYFLTSYFWAWAGNLQINPVWAIAMTWQMIPMERIFEDYKLGLNMEGTAYRYWVEHQDKIAKILKMRKVPKINHQGIDNIEC